MGPAPPKSGPPKIIERLIELLLPPTCREHVLGDLRERYTELRRYIAEVIYTVPRVIESRIRRTANPPVLLLATMAMYLSFIGAAWWFSLTKFLYEDHGLLRLAGPVVAVIVALVYLDAYSNPKRRIALRPVRQTVA